MIDFLLGVPGKLATIYTHLTTYLGSTRMAKVDNLDAAISTRAAAATALSTATWTPARAARLDLIAPPKAAGLDRTIDIVGGYTGSMVAVLDTFCEDIAAGGSFSYTGSGVLNLVVQTNEGGVGVSSSCTITIDGNAVLTTGNYTLETTSSRSLVGVAVGQYAIALDQVPFTTSITIACTGSQVHFLLRKTT